MLSEAEKAQIRDLTAGIGAVIGGAVGDSSYNAQLAGVIGQNAVENNQYAQFYVCNEKNQCVLVDDKPVQLFTFFEENFIRPISVLYGAVGKVVNINKTTTIDPSKVSTGRTQPKNLQEKLAMEQVKNNPQGKTPPRMPKMSDSKNNLHHEDGWVKRAQNVNGVEIHYVGNTKSGQKIDFKFKD